MNNNEEIEIDLGEVFHLLISKLGIIILSGIIPVSYTHLFLIIGISIML